MNYLKILRKTLVKIQDDQSIKFQLACNYKVAFEFISGNIERILVKPHFINTDDKPLFIILLSIPENFSFDFIENMCIPKKLFKKLLYHLTRRMLLLSLLTHIGIISKEAKSKLKNDLYENEEKIGWLFNKYPEIIDSNDFREIFLFE